MTVMRILSVIYGDKNNLSSLLVEINHLRDLFIQRIFCGEICSW